MSDLVVQSIPVRLVDQNPFQPRRSMNQTALQELADSIKLYGLRQPVEVSAQPNGRYQLHFGHRRLAAHKLARMTHIRALVVEPLDDDEQMLLALVENSQREDVGPIDEAYALQALLERVGSRREVSRRLGRSEQHVTGRLRLLDLPVETQSLVNAGTLSRDIRVTNAILSLPANLQADFAAQAAENSLGIAEIRGAARKVVSKLAHKNGSQPQAPPPSPTPTVRRSLNTSSPALALVFGAGGQHCLPPALQVAIESVCKACPYSTWEFGEQDKAVCRECPLTGFVRAGQDALAALVKREETNAV